MSRSTAAAEPALITLAEAIRILGISKTFAHDLIKKGEFPVPVIKIGSRYKVNRQHLDDFVTDRRPGEGRAAGG